MGRSRGGFSTKIHTAVDAPGNPVEFLLTAGRAADVTQAEPLIQRETRRDILDWLKVEHEIPEPSNRLRGPFDLDSDALIAEIKKIRGKKRPLSLAALRSLRDEHARTIVPTQALAAEARGLEQRVSDLVNEAYGLTPEEVRLMWETAPPRMPITRRELSPPISGGP